MEAEISEWRKLASDGLHVIANIRNTRISATASDSAAWEIMRENNQALSVIETAMTDMLSRAQGARHNEQ